MVSVKHKNITLHENTPFRTTKRQSKDQLLFTFCYLLCIFPVLMKGLKVRLLSAFSYTSKGLNGTLL